MKNYSRVSDDNSNTKYIDKALECVEHVTKSVQIPRESLLRDFFECILGLDQIAELIIDRVLQSSTPQSWSALSSFFRLLKQLALISGYWRNRINTFFGDDLVNSISNCEVPSGSERKKLLEKLKQSSLERKLSSSLTIDSDEDEEKRFIEPLTIDFH